MVKRISFFVALFTVCVFAENIAEAQQVVTEVAPAVQTEQIATEVAPAVQTEEVAAESAPAAEIAEAAPAVQAPAPSVVAVPAATGSAKEAIIEDPLEFAIVTAVFIATVVFITLTGK